MTKAITTNKISLKDVNLGDTVSVVQLLNEVEYLGKFSFIHAIINENRQVYRHLNGINLARDVIERYVFRDKVSNEYYYISSPKIASIKSKIDVPFDKPAKAAEFNRLIGLNLFKQFKNEHQVIGCFIGSKLEIEYRFQPVNQAEFKENLNAEQNIKSYFCRKDDKSYMLLN